MSLFSDRREFLAGCGYLTAGAACGLLAPRWLRGVAADERPVSTGAEGRLRALKLKLPPVVAPKATLVPAVRVGDMLYVSGHLPPAMDGKPWVGKLGKDFTV